MSLYINNLIQKTQKSESKFMGVSLAGAHRIELISEIPNHIQITQKLDGQSRPANDANFPGWHPGRY